ncbi:hypothetical protein K466DRAFT_605222, partial [Polyporus arcularius HHB13444]
MQSPTTSRLNPASQPANMKPEDIIRAWSRALLDGDRAPRPSAPLTGAIMQGYMLSQMNAFLSDPATRTAKLTHTCAVLEELCIAAQLIAVEPQDGHCLQLDGITTSTSTWLGMIVDRKADLIPEELQDLVRSLPDVATTLETMVSFSPADAPKDDVRSLLESIGSGLGSYGGNVSVSESYIQSSTSWSEGPSTQAGDLSSYVSTDSDDTFSMGNESGGTSQLRDSSTRDVGEGSAEMSLTIARSRRFINARDLSLPYPSDDTSLRETSQMVSMELASMADAAQFKDHSPLPLPAADTNESFGDETNNQLQMLQAEAALK